MRWLPLSICAVAILVGVACGSTTTESPATPDAGPGADASDASSSGRVVNILVIQTDADVTANADVIEVTGDLTLESGTVTKLSLPRLKSIGGRLSIERSDALTEISMPQLTKVGKWAGITNNKSLTSLKGLDALESAGAELTIANNPLIKSLEGLASLTSVGGDLAIEGNGALVSFDGLGALSTIGGTFKIWYNNSLCQSTIDEFITELTTRGWSGSPNVIASTPNDC